MVRAALERAVRLAELLEPGAVLLVDEFDVAAFDERAAGWWLRQRHALGAATEATAEELVGEHRAHLHPLERIVAALEPHFQVGRPLYGPYLYRWNLGEFFLPVAAVRWLHQAERLRRSWPHR